MISIPFFSASNLRSTNISTAYGIVALPELMSTSKLIESPILEVSGTTEASISLKLHSGSSSLNSLKAMVFYQQIIYPMTETNYCSRRSIPANFFDDYFFTFTSKLTPNSWDGNLFTNITLLLLPFLFYLLRPLWLMASIKICHILFKWLHH